VHKALARLQYSRVVSGFARLFMMATFIATSRLRSSSAGALALRPRWVFPHLLDDDLLRSDKRGQFKVLARLQRLRSLPLHGDDLLRSGRHRTTAFGFWLFPSPSAHAFFARLSNDR
jgi:hypothetical protein